MHMGTTWAWLLPKSQTSVHPHAHGDNATPRSVLPLRLSVHPHAHGDNAIVSRWWWRHQRFTPMHMGTTQNGDEAEPAATGSPPCTWGQREPVPPYPAGTRFTPMHMGTTEPHWLGFPISPGSPPCTWGQRMFERRRGGRHRFTPMHMGTTVRPRAAKPCCAVHPHAHGDNKTRILPIHTHRGSPPCTWGQRRLGSRPGGEPSVHPHAHGDNDAPGGRPAGRDRFTPMHMGTTAPGSKRAMEPGGSPPCTWGQRPPQIVGRRSLRFTPMHMGTTPCSPPPPSARTVHPHAHGDNALQKFLAGKQGGSPPCTWGQRRPAQAGRARTRFTPMHMGTTHPPMTEAERLRGSPPCTWGQRPRREPMAKPIRFTPMHMGTTSQGRWVSTGVSVHPHAHGDNSGGPGLMLGLVGSPPCTWGQRLTTD